MLRLRSWIIPGVVALSACYDGGPRAIDDDLGSESSDEVGVTESTDSLSDSSTGSTGDLPSDGSESDSGSEDTGDTGEPPAPPLYPGDRIHSPLTAHVVAAMQQIRAANPSAADNLFMKVGDSHTVSSGALFCFAGDNVDLDVHAATLQPSLDWFLTGEAAGTTPFDRVTLSAEIGRTASWAISGSPSPLQQELAALGFAGSGGPSVAMVHYGSNDMQMGITYASAMPGFYGNMSDLLDQLIAIGVVPVVFGVTRRLDNAAADRWVPTYTAVARALAQARELPFVDLRLALEPVPGYGIAGDGLHLTGYGSGACLLTPAGLGYGNNVRNLLALQAFARSRAALFDGEAADLEAPTLIGSGSQADPFQILELPFADSRNSVDGPGLELDVYSGCGSMADESGPEHLYRLELTETTAIRAMVLDRSGVDVDIHLLSAGAGEGDCLLRHDTLLETTLDPGTYYLSLDTWVDGQGVEQGGDYTFVILRCDAGDPDCAP